MRACTTLQALGNVQFTLWRLLTGGDKNAMKCLESSNLHDTYKIYISLASRLY